MSFMTDHQTALAVQREFPEHFTDCPACGGRPEWRPTCAVCAGTAKVSPPTVRQYTEEQGKIAERLDRLEERPSTPELAA